MRNEKPAVVCVYRFQLQTHTSQEKPFIRINMLSSGWSLSPQTFLLFCISAYLKKKELNFLKSEASNSRLEFDASDFKKKKELNFFVHFTYFFGYLWRQGLLSLRFQSNSEYKKTFRSIPFGSHYFFIFVNDLCFLLILCFQIALAEMSISDSRVYPRHEKWAKSPSSLSLRRTNAIINFNTVN